MAEPISSEELQILTEKLRAWIDTQPHLPKDVDDKILRRFVHSCYYDLEKAKTACELFFNLRANCPELVNDRDPQSAQVQKTLKLINLAQLRISGNRNLFVWQLNDPGLEKYEYLKDARLFFLSTDAWLIDNEDLEECDLVLMDVKDISLKFLTKFNVSVAKKLSKYQQEAMPIRLKQIHLVNAPPFIDKIFGLLKPFLRSDISEMVHFHKPKSETLYKYISKDDLPKDYGGNLRSMDELMKEVETLIMGKREHFLNDNMWKAEKKTKNKSENSSKIRSFRSLAID